MAKRQEERRHSIHIYINEISKRSFDTPPRSSPAQKQKTNSLGSALTLQRRQNTSTSTNSLVEWEIWFIRFIRFAYSTACLPIQYSRKEKSFRVTSCKTVLFIYYLRLIWLSLDCIYLVSSSGLVTLNAVSLKEFLDFYLHACTRSAACFACIVLSFHLHSIVQVVNTLWRTNTAWTDNFDWWSSPFSGPLERRWTHLVKFAVIFVSVQGFLPVVMHFENRMSRRYWAAHYLSKETYDSIPVVIAVAFNDYILGSIAVVGSGYLGIVIVKGFVLLRFWTDSLIAKLIAYRRLGKVYCLEPLKLFRLLLVVNGIINVGIGSHIMPTILGLGFPCLVGLITISIRSFSNLPFIVKMNVGGGCVLLLAAIRETFLSGGRLHKKSFQLRHCLFTEELHCNLLDKGKEYNRKYLSSCRDMRLYYGSFFFSRSVTFLTFTKLLLDQCITVMLSL